MKQFGIGRLGALIVNHAKPFAALAAAVTVGALAAIPGGLLFNGNITDLLRVDTPGYRELQRVEKDFHPFSTDAVIVVESTGFGDQAAFDALAELVAELQLTTGVEAVVSIFSLPIHGATLPYLASPEADGLSPEQRLATLRQGQFLAPDLLSQDLTTTLVVLAMAQDGASPTELGAEGRQEIEDAAARHAPVLSVSFAGMGEIHRSIEEGLRRDQHLLAGMSTLLCVVLSLLIFRSWRGALICAVPPVTGALWFFGFAALAGIAINPVTAIIPTLIIVVGFADSVHLYFTYLRVRPQSRDVADAARRTMVETGPACFLTCLTTGVSCLGVGAAGSAALNAFAIGGFFGMLLQFLATLLCFPLLLIALQRGGRPVHIPGGGAFSLVARGATGLLRYSRVVLPLSIAAFAVLFYGHAQLPIGFQLSEHLSRDGDLAKLQQRIGARGLGSAYVYLIIPDADGAKGLSAADVAVFRRIGAALFAERLGETGGVPFLSAEQLDRLAAEDPALLKRFVSADGLRYLLPIPLDPTLPSEQIEAECATILAKVQAAGLPGQAEIVGLPLLSAREVPAMIQDLQLGFLASFLLEVMIIVFAAGSLRLGVLPVIANLMPILGIEAFLYLASEPLTMTAAVALTIAFGIAVDNSIHVLSRYQQPSDADRATRLRQTVSEVTAPILTTTLLLVVGLSVTQVSTMPAVAVFGQLVSAALLLAMASSLFLLPAFIDPRYRRDPKT